MADPVTGGLFIASLVFTVASYLLTPKPKISKTPFQAPEIPNSDYGTAIPIGYGMVFLNGVTYWASDPQVKSQSVETSSGGKGSPPPPTEDVAYLTFGCVFAANQSYGLRRLWLNSKLYLDFSDPNPSAAVTEQNNKWIPYVKYYDGNPNQSPDPDYQANLGVNNAPANRGYTTIVFSGLPAKDFSNGYPAVRAEFLFKPIASGGQIGAGQCIGVDYQIQYELTSNGNPSPLVVNTNGFPGTYNTSAQVYNTVRQGAVCGVRVDLSSQAYDHPVRGFPSPTFAPPDNYGTVVLVTSYGNIPIAQGLEYGVGYTLSPLEQDYRAGTFSYTGAEPTGNRGSARILGFTRLDGQPDNCAYAPACTPYAPQFPYIPYQAFDLKEAVDTIIAQTALNPAVDCDTTPLAGLTVNGWTLTAGSIRDNLLNLLLPFQIDVASDRDKIRFTLPDSNPVKVIDLKSVGYRSSATGFEAQSLSVRTLPRQIDLPGIVRLKYSDPLFEGQDGETVFHRHQRIGLNARQIEDLDTRAYLTVQQANNLVVKLATRLTQRDTEIEFTLGSEHFDLRAGQTILVDYLDQGVAKPLKLVEVNYSTDGIVSCRATPYVSLNNYIPPVTADPVYADPAPIAGTAYAKFLQVPYIGTQPGEKPDVVYGYIYNTGTAIVSASVRVTVNGTPYDVATGVSGVIEGLALNVLPNIDGEQFTSDSLTVSFNSPVNLLNYSLTDILGSQWDGLICVGSELIKYQRAIQLSGGTWVLSGLLRGLWGTDTAVHSTNETVVIWDVERILPIVVPEPIIGANYSIQTTDSVGRVTASSMIYQVNSRRPYSASHYEAKKINTGSIILTWKRRSRGYGESWANPGAVPLNEATESYTIKIYNGVVLARTQAGLTQEAYEYTQAEQIADTGSAIAVGTQLRLAITQKGLDSVGTTLEGFTQTRTVTVS